MKIGGIQVHASLTLDRVCEAVERHLGSLDDPGFCVACGASCDGVEPDACGYECEVCGCYAVYGADELLIRLF